MLENTLFPVKEEPAYWEQIKKNKGNGTSVREMSTPYKFIVREDTGKVLSCMTDDYRMVTNQEVINTAQPILEKHGGELKEAISFGDGERTTWKWIIPDVKVKVQKNDFVSPEIIIRNSYDGSLQVHVLSGAFRLVCSNGLVIGTVISKHNHKHSIYNSSLNKLDEAIEQTVNTTTKIFGEDFPILCDTNIREKHILELIKLFPSTMSEFIVQYLVANKPETYWDLLNVGTYIASHKMKRQNHATHKLENNVYPNISKWAKQVAKA